jgi:hypothetical protein
MTVIAYVLGLWLIAVGSCLILYPQAVVNAVKALCNKVPLRGIGVIQAVFGLLFLISASAVTYPWVFRVIGLLAFAEAALAFFNPQGIYTRMLDWYFTKVTEQTQRLFGIIGIIFGTAILSWVI